MAAISSLILGGLALGQTVLGVANARKSAKAARKTAGFEADQLEQQASDALLIGNQSAQHIESQGRLLTGAQKVRIAASGIESGSGSAADVISNDQRETVLAALTERNNAAREALGYRKQAALVRMGGQNQAQSYANQATSTVLSGAAKLWDVYSNYGINRTPRRQKPPQSGGFEGEWRPDTGGW